MNNEWMTLKEAAKCLGVSKRSLYRLVAEGTMPCTAMTMQRIVLKVDKNLIETVATRLPKDPKPRDVRKLMKQMKEGNNGRDS